MSNPNGFPEIDLDVLVGPPDDFEIDLDVMVGGDTASEKTWLLSQVLRTHYSICPFCGEEVDLSTIIDLFEPGIYPYCPCFQNSQGWQNRMAVRSLDINNLDHPPTVGVKNTCTAVSIQSVVSLVLTPERKTIIENRHWRWVWKTFLIVDPSVIGDEYDLRTVQLWPTIQQAVDLLIVTENLQKRLSELLKRLGRNPAHVDEKTISALLGMIKSLDEYLIDILWRHPAV